MLPQTLDSSPVLLLTRDGNRSQAALAEKVLKVDMEEEDLVARKLEHTGSIHLFNLRAQASPFDFSAPRNVVR